MLVCLVTFAFIFKVMTVIDRDVAEVGCSSLPSFQLLTEVFVMFATGCRTVHNMLQSSAVKPSAAAAGSVVTDPTLRLMAAAAAAAGGRSGRLAAGPPSELTPRPSVAAAAAANELYASLLYSHQHQLDRAAMLMQQHAHQSPFPAVSQRGAQQSQAATGHAQPPQAHTGGFALPQYQPSHPHPHHLQAAGPAAAAAFESYSQSLATLSQLSQRLQLHAAPHCSRLPAPPAALGVDPYLAAAAAAVHGGRAGSPACKRQVSLSSPAAKTPTSDSTAALVSTQTTAHQSSRHRNPYDFCEPELSPDDKFHIHYKDDDVKESHQHYRHHHHHHHHHNSHHIQQQQQQQQRKPEVGVVGELCHDENHNAFNNEYRSALQLHRRDKRQEASITHAQTVLPHASPPVRQHDQGHQSASSDTASKDAVVLTATGDGSDVINESSEVLLNGRRSTAVNYKSGCHRRHHRGRGQRADFTHGSMIQLSDGRVKRIEDMRTEDFVFNSSSSSVKLTSGRGMTSSQLVLVSSRVVHIRLNHDTCTAVLGFVVDDNIHSPVSIISLTPISICYFITARYTSA